MADIVRQADVIVNRPTCGHCIYAVRIADSMIAWREDPTQGQATGRHARRSPCRPGTAPLGASPAGRRPVVRFASPAGRRPVVRFVRAAVRPRCRSRAARARAATGSYQQARARASNSALSGLSEGLGIVHSRASAHHASCVIKSTSVRPVSIYAIIFPKENTSAAGCASTPWRCSGDKPLLRQEMQSGVTLTVAYRWSTREPPFARLPMSSFYLQQ